MSYTIDQFVAYLHREGFEPASSERTQWHQFYDKKLDEHVTIRVYLPLLKNDFFQFKGKIARVADFVDPQSRTIRVRGEVANADRRLKGEMFVQASVELPPSRALHVPAGAVFLQGDTRYAFVEEAAGRYRRQKVDAGNGRDGWVDIWSGLKAGEKVVVEGNLHLLKYFKPQAGARK